MMKRYDIKNPRVLALLERFRHLYIDKYDLPNTSNSMGKTSDNPNDWLSSEYLHSIMTLEGYDGSPHKARSYPIKPAHYKGSDKDEYYNDFAEIDNDIMSELGLEANALSQLYPPEGFIAWHSNANAPGYNLIFTWSETGDGWFKFIDHDGKEVHMQDKPGWTLKAGYFGTEEEGPVFHAAYTNCWRMTHSFVVARHDKDYWLDCLDYIQSA